MLALSKSSFIIEFAISFCTVICHIYVTINGTQVIRYGFLQNELMKSAGIVLIAPYKNAESIYLNTPVSSSLLFTSTNDKSSAESSYWLNCGNIIRIERLNRRTKMLSRILTDNISNCLFGLC